MLCAAVDEGWLKSRDGNGNIVSDPVKFPSGMKALGDWIHSQSPSPGVFMKYGLYTCRGSE
jgi:alpha-galactosidase